MRVFRTELHGNLIELRKGDFGGETVLVNGRKTSEMPLAGLGGASHFFDIHDEEDRAFHVELRHVIASKWRLGELGIGKHCVIVSVNGRQRMQIFPVDEKSMSEACFNCGYSLAGLPVENDEVRCPECGRHTPAIYLPRIDTSSHDGGDRVKRHEGSEGGPGNS